MQQDDREKPGVIFSLNDVFLLVFKYKRRLLFSAFAFALLAAFFTLSKPVQYLAEASFKESSNQPIIGASGLKSLINLGNDSSAEDGKVMMLSKEVLVPLIQGLHMQADIQLLDGSSSIMTRAKENLRIAYHELRDRMSKEACLQDYNMSLVACEVHFEEEYPQKYLIRFSDEENYHVLDVKTQRDIATGKIDENVSLPGERSSFCLRSNNSYSLKGKEFQLTFIPLENVITSLKNEISISPHKEISSILELQYKHRDRHFAAKLLNCLMEQYRQYLTQTNFMKSDLQLRYLKSRQSETEKSLEDLYRQQEEFYTENIHSGLSGFSGQELQFLTQSQQEFQTRLFELNLSKRMLEQSYERPELFNKDLTKQFYENDIEPIDNINYRLRDLNQTLENLNAQLALVSEGSQEYQELTSRISESKKRIDALKKRFLTFWNNSSNNLKLHEEIVLNQIEDLSKQMQTLPQKYLLENRLQFQKELGIEVLKKVTEMVENTVIQDNLSSINSRPLVYAVPPITPRSPRLFFMLSFGAFCGASFMLAFVVFTKIQSELPVSKENTSGKGLSYLGDFSRDFETKKSSSDLRTLAKLQNILSGSATFKLPVFILNAKNDLNEIVSPLISSDGSRVLSIAFHQSGENLGDEIALKSMDSASSVIKGFIRSKGSYENLVVQMEDENYLSLIAQEKFHALIRELQNEYDKVLCFAHFPIGSFQSEVLSQISDKCILLLRDESVQEVESLINAATKKPEFYSIFLS